MAPNYKILFFILITCGSFCILASVLIFFKTTQVFYDYGIFINENLFTSDFYLYKWPCNKTQDSISLPLVSSCSTSKILETSDFSEYEMCLNQLIQLSSSDSDSIVKLYFGSTGNIRLLNDLDSNKASTELEKVENYLKNFKTNNTKLNVTSVELISIEEESIYNWITFNFLSSTLKPSQGNSSPTFGIFYIDEGDSLLAYQINSTKRANSKTVQLFGKNYTVYSQSSRCFGSFLAEIRLLLNLIHTSNLVNDIPNPCMPSDSKTFINVTSFQKNKCFEGSLISKIKGENFTFAGVKNFEECQKSIKSVLLDKSFCESNFKFCLNSEQLSPPSTMKFKALYKYGVAFDELNNLREKYTLVSDYLFLNQTKMICGFSFAEVTSFTQIDNINTLCFRLLYNYLTLKEALKVTGNFSNIEFSSHNHPWALGYMLNATNITQPEPISSFHNYYFWGFSYLGVILCTISIYCLLLSLKKNAVENREIYEPIQQQVQ